MCELLIRIRDKVQPDPYLACKLFGRGDVVVACADDWGWTEAEKVNPDWRILKLPNVPLELAQDFISPEADADPANPSRMLRRRAALLDVDLASLPTAFKNWLKDDTRAAPTRTVTYTPAQLAGLLKVKAPLQDPNVLG